MLENVDRLLPPTSQRGRDFAKLASSADLATSSNGESLMNQIMVKTKTTTCVSSNGICSNADLNMNLSKTNLIVKQWMEKDIC